MQINYPAACNATETLLIHSNALPTILPSLSRALLTKNVKIRADPRSLAQITSSLSESEVNGNVIAATDADFDTEFLDLTIAIKTVDSITEAIAHINARGSHHTDGIVTENEEMAELFMGRVDAAGVYWNASTR